MTNSSSKKLNSQISNMIQISSQENMILNNIDYFKFKIRLSMQALWKASVQTIRTSNLHCSYQLYE